MHYPNLERGTFLERPNRFIAHVALNGKPVVCHVKNTGRCKELLVPGAAVGIQHAPSPGRKTEWDLISVQKGERLINMDAAAPNRAFEEWAAKGGFLPGLTMLKREAVHGDSRFDLYMETADKRLFAEIKGVTLEKDGVARFPDAPTARGVKHLRGLMNCVKQGYEAWAVFVIQMRGVRYMEANRFTHPEFADAMQEARQAGVHLLALDCRVTWDEMEIGEPVIIR